MQINRPADDSDAREHAHTLGKIQPSNFDAVVGCGSTSKCLWIIALKNLVD
jgi:hypothetical protein